MEASLKSAATLIMGPTGSGKSTLIATLAEWLWKNHKKITRLYSSDPGGYGDKVQALVEKGIIQVWRIRTRDPDARFNLPLETVERATQGYWPKVWDPISGDTEPKVELVNPRTKQYQLICKCGKIVKFAAVASLLTEGKCECGEQVTPQTCKEVRETTTATPGFEKVGVVVYDSFTSLSEWCTRDMADRMAKSEIGGEKAAINQVRSGNLNFGGLNRSSIGFVQERACGWVQNSNAIKDLVLPPVFTSLELQASDEGDIRFYGPKITGRAKTDEIPSWFGNCLGTAVVETDKGRQWRLYIEKYKLDDGIEHRCKNRAIEGTFKEIAPEGYLADVAGEDIAFTKFNLGYFLEILNHSLDKERQRLNAEIEDAPGLPTGSVGGPSAGPIAASKPPVQGAGASPSAAPKTTAGVTSSPATSKASVPPVMIPKAR